MKQGTPLKGSAQNGDVQQDSTALKPCSCMVQQKFTSSHGTQKLIY